MKTIEQVIYYLEQRALWTQKEMDKVRLEVEKNALPDDLLLYRDLILMGNVVIDALRFAGYDC